VGRLAPTAGTPAEEQIGAAAGRWPVAGRRGERSAEAEGSSGEVGKSSGEAAAWVGLRQQQGRLPRSR